MVLRSALYNVFRSIPTLVFGIVSCRNHSKIDPIFSMGDGIELAELSVCTSSWVPVPVGLDGGGNPRLKLYFSHGDLEHGI